MCGSRVNGYANCVMKFFRTGSRMSRRVSHVCIHVVWEWVDVEREPDWCGHAQSGRLDQRNVRDRRILG
jgi:hypothetical protein